MRAEQIRLEHITNKWSLRSYLYQVLCGALGIQGWTRTFLPLGAHIQACVHSSSTPCWTSYETFYQRNPLCPGQTGMGTKAPVMVSDLNLNLGTAAQQLCESKWCTGQVADGGEDSSQEDKVPGLWLAPQCVAPLQYMKVLSLFSVLRTHSSSINSQPNIP